MLRIIEAPASVRIHRQEGPLFWIQSVDDPDIALVLTDPTCFFLDYRVLVISYGALMEP